MYTTERALADAGDNLDPAVKLEIENAVADLKKASEANDKEGMKNGIANLNNVAQKLAQAQQAGPNPGAGATGPDASASSAKDEPEVVEGEIVDDNK